jgi:competence protein ComEC
MNAFPTIIRGVMNRPIIFITISYIAGIALAAVFKIPVIAAVILLIAAGAAAFYFRRKTDKILFPVFAVLGMMLFSFGYTWFPKNDIKNYKAVDEVKSAEVLVDTLPEESEGRTYFTAKILKLYNKENEITGVTGKIRVTVEQALGEKIKYGDVLRIKSALKEPAEPKNPGEFNYKEYLKKDRIYYTVYARGQAVEKTGYSINNPFYQVSSRVKEKLVSIIYKSLPEQEAIILDGLMLGNQRAIPDETYDKFKTTGTVHILAVSGMNVGLISLFVFLLLKLCRVKKKAAAALTLGFITVFCVITGAGASIVRATIMAYVILISIIIEQDTDIMNSLALAALAILLFNPVDLLDIGFQMSFLATFGIIYYSEFSKKLPKKMPAWLAMTLFSTISAQIFLTPVMANTFHQVSVITILANLFIVPLSGIISILGFVMWLFGTLSAEAAKIFGASIWLMIKAMNAIVDILAAVPYAALSIKTIPPAAVFFYCLFFLILPHEDIEIRINRIHVKTVFGVLLAGFFVFHLFVPEPGARLYALAAKDMHAVLLKTGDNKKIFILGCDDYEKNTGMRNAVIPFLRYLGINNIDNLLLYSVKNEKNLKCLNMNFRVLNAVKDEDLRGGAFYRSIGKTARLNMNGYLAEIEYTNNVFIFTKLLAGRAATAGGKVIYTCFYSDIALVNTARDNTCIINSGTIRGFGKRKPIENANIWDVNEKGCYMLKM